MEQPKKPIGSGRDIADLKARLGLAKGPAAVPAPGGVPAPGRMPAAGGFPAPGGAPAQVPVPAPGFAVPNAIPSPVVPPPMAAPPAAAQPAAPRFDDPFAGMRPPEGKHFDLRPVDDGKPTESVSQKGGMGGKVILGIAVIVAAAAGFGFGGASVGRRMYNSANFGAKRVKAELEEMQKTVNDIGQKVAMSQQRLAAAKMDALAYDGKLIEELEAVKLDPRPDTSKIFKVNYYLLEDLAVDRLMNYYYDTINLYGEVERHVKRTKADKTVLEQMAAKQAKSAGEDEKGGANYGVVFASGGKLAIANLVEVGKPVCKGGAEDYSNAADIEGFQIRSNTGAPWTSRKIGPKPEGDKVVPIDKTPLFQAVMNGSPDQVRYEQYKQRYNNIRLLLQRLAQTRKELGDAIDKAATRPDLFSL